MDGDRKSTVSSFYGRPRSSYDALNQDYPSPSAQPRQPRDDASSFFNPAARPPGAADRNSYFFNGQSNQEYRDDAHGYSTADTGFDIYADFNNAGPKYSSAFGIQQDTGYRPVSTTPMSSATTPKIIEDSASSAGPVEMVTVPALGPEWGKEEMRNMTKKARRERKYESRHDKWVAWKRGERGMCGKWFNRKMTAWVMFALIIIIALVLAFCIPRVPAVSWANNSQYLVNVTDGDLADTEPQFSRVPANFSFAAAANLQMNTQDNFLSVHFSKIKAKVYDSETNEVVAKGETGSMTLPAKQYPNVQIPLLFEYSGSNDTDTTWLNWYDGCKNKAASVGGERPALKFKVVLDMHITGLPKSYGGAVTANDAECPFELSQNAA